MTKDEFVQFAKIKAAYLKDVEHTFLYCAFETVRDAYRAEWELPRNLGAHNNSTSLYHTIDSKIFIVAAETKPAARAVEKIIEASKRPFADGGKVLHKIRVGINIAFV